MKRRKLPGTDLDCSVVGLGTWGLGGPNDVDGVSLGWPTVDKADAAAVIKGALDSGIDFFDSSDFYGRGRAEELLGETLRSIRDPVVVATKVGILPRLRPGSQDLERDFSAAHIERSAEASLKRLRRDTIDLYQLHGPGGDVLESDETWLALERLRASGKIRFVGVSLKSSQSHAAALQRWLAVPLVSSVQLQYSLAEQSMLAEVAVGARDSRGAVIARSVFGHGLLLRHRAKSGQSGPSDHRRHKDSDDVRARVESFQVALGKSVAKRSLLECVLRYAMDSPAVNLTLVGATRRDQVAEISSACEVPALTGDERAAIEAAAFSAFNEGARP